MADSRSWKGSGVRRDDQFERPPTFRDAHESNHLSGEAASWHGSGSRHLTLAVGLALAAGIAAVAFMLFVAPSSGIGTQMPVGAQGDDAPFDGGVPQEEPIDIGDVEVPGTPPAGNATSSPLPPLPAPPVA